MPFRARLCLILLAVPLVFCGLADIDSWPFSNFPMYSAPFRLHSFQHHLVYVVPRQGKAYQIRDGGLLWPLNYQRVQVRAWYFTTLPDGQERIREMLRYYSRRVLARYQKEGRVTGFPQKLQLRRCFGNFEMRNGALYPKIYRHEVLAEVRVDE